MAASVSKMTKEQMKKKSAGISNASSIEAWRRQRNGEIKRHEIINVSNNQHRHLFVIAALSNNQIARLAKKISSVISNNGSVSAMAQQPIISNIGCVALASGGGGIMTRMAGMNVISLAKSNENQAA